MASQNKLDYKKLTPFIQGGIVLLLIMLVNLLTYVLGVGNDRFFDPSIYWINTIAFILVYILFNSILSIITKDQNKYWAQSIITYSVICIMGGLIAWLISGLSIDDAGSFRWIYMVFTFGYIILLTIVRSMRKIVKLAQKQDKKLRGER